MKQLFKKSVVASVLVLATTGASAGGSQYYANASAAAPYSKAVQSGDLVYVSGLLGRGADGNVLKGLDAQVKGAMDSLVGTLKSVGLTADDVVKCQVFMTDISKLSDLGKVYVTYFKPDRLPARTSIGVSALPFGAEVEIDCIAHVAAK
ncbi:MAG: RidA family protein [Pseudomonadota bacterium]